MGGIFGPHGDVDGSGGRRIGHGRGGLVQVRLALLNDGGGSRLIPVMLGGKAGHLLLMVGGEQEDDSSHGDPVCDQFQVMGDPGEDEGGGHRFACRL
jgi:hypothetical protein